jgi:hypothetical protein
MKVIMSDKLIENEESIHAIAIIKWKGFQYLSEDWNTEEGYYASGQKQLINYVGNGGTLWVITRNPQSDFPVSISVKIKTRRLSNS